jgi:hypothetical protein
MKTIFLSLFLFCATALQAQIEVHYNVFNDSLTWHKNGKTVKRPKVRSGDNIIVKLVDFNQLLYTSLDTVVYTEADYSDALAVLSAVMAPSGTPRFEPLNTMSGIAVSSDPAIPLPIFLVPDFKNLVHKPGASDKIDATDLSQKLSDAEAVVAEISESIEAYRTHYQVLKDLKHSAKVSLLAVDQIGDLAESENLRPSVGHQLATDYYRLVFRQDPSEKLSIDDVIAYDGIPEEFESNLDMIRTLRPRFIEQNLRLDSVTTDLALTDISQLPAQSIAEVKTMIKELQFASTLANQIDQQWEVLEKKIEVPESLSMLGAANLQIKILAYLSKPITKNHYVKMRGEEAIFTAVIFPKGKENEVEPVKTIKVNLNTYGGMRIKAGAGVQFTRFFKPEKQYGVNQGLIVSESADQIAPTFTTLIHFFQAPRRSTSFGASFGVGLPLQADAQGLSFFLGPSLLFGSDSQLALTGGFILAKATRLAKGWAVGDTFDLTLGDLPMRNGYETGIFLGISFNMLGAKVTP